MLMTALSRVLFFKGLEGQHQRTIDVADGPQAAEGDGGSGRVNSVGPKDLQNVRLVIDIGDDRTVEIPLKGKLILQNSGPPRADAAAGDAAPGNAGQGQSAPDDEDKEFLLQMRGWLMTVATLFVTMAFQAALQPPAWLRTTDFLRHELIQSEIDRWNHRYHGASHAAAARFAPSPTLSPQAAESATAGLSWRAKAYMYCNYFTFGNSLALVLMLMLPRNIRPNWAVIFLLVIISLCVVGTLVLGSSEDCRYTLSAFFFTVLPVCSIFVYPIGTVLYKCIATFRQKILPAIARFRAGGASPRP